MHLGPVCVFFADGHGECLEIQGVCVCVGFSSPPLRYHLQALRHLCVLAAEPRLLVPVDVDTLKPCYALLDVTYKVLCSYCQL